MIRSTSLLARGIGLGPLIAVLAWPAHAQTLIHNINGYTCEANGRLARFVAIQVDAQGRVAERWSSAAEVVGARAAAPVGMSIVDGAGQTLLPGLIDAHGHVRALGEARGRVNLVGTRSLDEALERVAAYAEAHPQAPWVVGRGWNQEQWPGGKFPTASDLDRVVKDRPVYLGRIDGHAAWVNSKALAVAEITGADDAPVGGRVEVDERGNPTGVLIDAAGNLVELLVPTPSRADDKAAIVRALTELASLGITGVHDAGITPQDLLIYRELALAGELPIRVYAMLAESARDALEAPLVGEGNDYLTVSSVKVYADGALGSRGAALLASYADEAGNQGLAFKADSALAALVRETSARGFQVNVHAIGDAANRMVLDAFAQVPPHERTVRRHRVEHAQIIHPDDIARFADLNVIASMQPTHATSDMFMAVKRLDPQRLVGAYAWRRLIEGGAKIAAGSDFPVEPANPFFGLHAAVTRRSRDGRPAAGWIVEEAMTRTEALCAFTSEGAFAAHAEDRQGRLDRGYWADFILIDADPLEIPSQEIWKIGVGATWVSGKPIYEASGTR
ncbi:MAG: amidohydrolase family protein [Pseudomonadota bacterium]